MDSIEVLAKEVPHPFNCYPTTTQLNPKAFVRIEGEGEYEEYSWSDDGSNFESEADAGRAIEINADNIDLYENSDSITVVFPDSNKGYRYPKSLFFLIKR